MNKIFLKKINLFIVFILLVFNNAHAQDKNNIFFNIGSPTTPVFIGWSLGIGYERAVNKNIAFIGSGDFAFRLITVMDAPYGNETGAEIDLLAHLRYYPFSTVSGKIFLDAGIGYTFLSMTTSETKISNLLTLQAQTGWKFIIKRSFIQPWIGYNMTIGKTNYPKWATELDIEEYSTYGFVNIGLSIGFNF
jgi:hypothetical protein